MKVSKIIRSAAGMKNNSQINGTLIYSDSYGLLLFLL